MQDSMYMVEVSGSGQSPLTVRSKDYTFSIDIHGNGITPPDTLLAGLAGCVAVYIRKYADGTGLTIHDFTVRAEGELSKEKPVAFRHIRLAIDLKGAEIDERRRHSLAEFIKNCPVHNTLHVNPDISVTLL